MSKNSSSHEISEQPTRNDLTYEPGNSSDFEQSRGTDIDIPSAGNKAIGAPTFSNVALIQALPSNA